MRIFATVFWIATQFLIVCPAMAMDHGDFVKEAYPDGPSVTEDCLSCHEKEGEAFMDSAHWRWKGHAPFTEGNGRESELGKRNLMNNY